MATLIGNGGHGQDIWAALPSHGGWKWIGHHEEFVDDQSLIIIGINDPHIRADVARELGVADHPWKHPNAYMAGSCSFDYGTHINYGVTMTRTTIGHHTTIGPGVTIGGDVTIGDRVNICMAAIIGVRHPGETVTIGDDATIGAGAVVLHDIPAGETWVGNPARRLR